MAILTADGKLTTYDTRTFFILQSYDAMGTARYCYFHPEGKYIAIVTGDKRISILNLMDEKDREYIDNAEGRGDFPCVQHGKLHHVRADEQIIPQLQ